MKCIVCHVEVTRSSDVAIEYVSWKTDLGELQEKATGRAVHIMCLNGDAYNIQQMTIQEAIGN